MEEEGTQFRNVNAGPPVESSYNGKKGDSKALLLILSLIVLIVIGVVAFFLRDKLIKPSEQFQPSPSPIVQEFPSPSPSSELDRSKYTLRVLNGTKTAGLAASVSAKLKELGYNIDKTGNSSGSALPRTLVKVKAAVSELLEQLIKDLSPDYDASASAELKDSDTVDGEITIGAK